MASPIVLPLELVARTLYIPFEVFSTVPTATAVSSSLFLNSTVAMFAFSIDFQSINFTYPADSACEKLYIALDASSALAPDTAASLLTPFIAITAVSRSTPAFVNFPILLVISLKEYIVLSE